MSTWNDLKTAADTAKSALDTAREEIAAAQQRVERVLADVNTAVQTRVDTRNPDTPIPTAELAAALSDLRAVETKYALPAKAADRTSP